jgi:hypothetical protein
MVYIEPTYQGVITPRPMVRLHSGRFCDSHEKWAKIDAHIRGDTNVTRLRVYTLCTFARIALANTAAGDFLSGGVSYGTAALVAAEYLKLENESRCVYLVDPFTGFMSASDTRTNAESYNLDIETVKRRWNPLIPAVWIREFLTPSSIAHVPPLAFVHLNTGDFTSELTSLPLLFEKLVRGGFIILDLYGWANQTEQRAIDALLEELGAESYMCVTQQLVIFRP